MDTALDNRDRVMGLLVAAIGLLWLGYMVDATAGGNRLWLFVIAIGMGLALYHAAFGFSGSWRALIAERRSIGLRVQMIMLGLAVLLFFPALGAGEVFGQPVQGSIAPAGTSVAVGAFLFGVGMQLSGGCASGTLFTVGGGNAKMVITLAGFVAGSVIVTHHVHWWWALPEPPSIALWQSLGVWNALALNLTVFAGIYMLARWLEIRRHGSAQPLKAELMRPGVSLLKGPWPMLWAALALALLNFATLYVAGRPWGITSAFVLWGGKGAVAIGIDPTAWPYWQGSEGWLARSVLYDRTSVMNFGIMGGAFIASISAGRFRPEWKIPPGAAIAALIGGLLLGYGARLAYGCNIGAFFSGVASGSLHGWLWLLAALPGNALGIRLRPLFGLSR